MIVKFKSPEARLEDLAKQINGKLECLRRSLCTSVQHARRVGKLLKRAKTTVGHGGFREWVKKNVNVKLRQAEIYLDLAEYGKKLDVRHPGWWKELTITDAAKQISVLKREEKAKKNSGSANGALPDPVAAHELRCKQLEKLRSNAKLREADRKVLQLVESDRPLLAKGIVELARRHGRRLSRAKEISQQEPDAELMAMLLCDRLELDATRLFAPVAAADTQAVKVEEETATAAS